MEQTLCNLGSFLHLWAKKQGSLLPLWQSQFLPETRWDPSILVVFSAVRTLLLGVISTPFENQHMATEIHMLVEELGFFHEDFLFL